MKKTFRLPKGHKSEMILLNNKEAELPKYLYHYTSFSTFFYIMGTMGTKVEYSHELCTFHASAAKSMDDLAEIEHYDMVLKEVKAAKGIGTWTELFVLSLSEAEDNMMMWETYADHGKGLCLKLDVEQLLDNPSLFYSAKDVNEMKDILPLDVKEGEFKENAFFAKCQYTLNNQEYLEYKRLIGKFEKASDPMVKMNLLRKIRLYSAVFKRTGYESEKEWRFLIDSSDIRFKYHGRMGISAYTEFQIPAKALSSIIIGPRAEERYQSYILKLLCEKTDVLALNNIEKSQMAGKVLKY